MNKDRIKELLSSAYEVSLKKCGKVSGRVKFSNSKDLLPKENRLSLIFIYACLMGEGKCYGHVVCPYEMELKMIKKELQEEGITFESKDYFIESVQNRIGKFWDKELKSG